MERFYEIKDNYAIINLSKNIYPVLAVQKAIVNYIEILYIKIEEQENNLILKIKLKEENIDLEEIINEFYNELLRESLRYNISKETKNLRELIVGRALYTTCIETDEENITEESNENQVEEISEDEDFQLDEIAINWFEKYDDIND